MATLIEDRSKEWEMINTHKELLAEAEDIARKATGFRRLSLADQQEMIRNIALALFRARENKEGKS